jgi:FkbM family methyltransferase
MDRKSPAANREPQTAKGTPQTANRKPQTANRDQQTANANSLLPVGHHYRDRNWLERWTESMRFTGAPAWVRAPLKGAYETALRTLAGDRLRCRLPDGETVLVDPSYRHLTWNADEYAALKACTRPGATVLDLGANVGAYTLLFAQWVGAGGHVYAFEPASASRAGLERHVSINGLADRVTIRPDAVSSASGVCRFIQRGTDGGNRIAHASDADTVEVPAITVDEFCGSFRVTPDVIKIDVEGAELEALRGARRIIAERGASLALFVELHVSAWLTLGISRTDIEDELRAQRLAVEPLEPARDPWSTEGIAVRLRYIG